VRFLSGHSGWRISISRCTVIVAAVKLIDVEATQATPQETTAFQELFLMGETSLAHYLRSGKGLKGFEGFEEFMARIEIPNVYNSGTAAGPRRGRFAVMGEPIVAVDLINTAAAPGSSAGNDLLSVERGAEAWWRVERERVPPGELPDIRALRRLRSALRDMIEALVDDRPVAKAPVSELNFFMRSAPASTRLAMTAEGLRTDTHWHREFGGNPRLAFIATQAAEFLSDPSQVRRLRRCANPLCSMIFIAVNPRRSWCAPGVCGNRVRVARHHRRTAGA
jgi:predicted RNA-binding Zn ribbon-like protein